MIKLIKNKFGVQIALVIIGIFAIGGVVFFIGTRMAEPSAADALQSENLLQSPGSYQLAVFKSDKNPLVTTAPWFLDYTPEHPRVIKMGETYFMYFHATVGVPRPPYWVWEIGLATAPSPEGPWSVADEPVLLPTPEDWDSNHVACPFVMQMGDTYFIMYYSGHGSSGWGIGIATAPDPRGPWTKYAGNPIYPGQWVGTVLQEGDTFYMWQGGETSGLMLTAPSPYGPWTSGLDMPVGASGEWDSYGINGEIGVYDLNGVFHIFYPGVLSSEEAHTLVPMEIGYASSTDRGETWTKYAHNPLITRGNGDRWNPFKLSLGSIPSEAASWDSFRLSKVGVYYEKGVFYVYYTGIHFQTGYESRRVKGPLPGAFEGICLAQVIAQPLK